MRAIVVVLIAGLLLSGCARILCTKNDRFDPEGNDAHIVGSWTIDGQKGTAESCSFARTVDGGMGTVSVSQIELVIWNEDESEPWINDRLLVDCNIGVTIDTRTKSDGKESDKLLADPLLKAGRYRVQWVALANNGDLIDCKPLEDLIIPAASDPDTPAVITLSPVDIKLNAMCETCPCS